VLTAVLAMVISPVGVGSWTSQLASSGPLAFRPVRNVDAGGTMTAPPTPDPRDRAAAALGDDGVVVDSVIHSPVADRPTVDVPANRPAVEVPAGEATAVGIWQLDPQISWFGPGFYGEGTACGVTLTESLMGVAHRSLPCGTLVTFMNIKTGATITVPVVDRGPYVGGRIFDLTGGACTALGHCWTGPIYYHLGP
jgi:hypothetical protein